MALADTLARIAEDFSELGTGNPVGIVRDTLFADLGQAFLQLKTDLAATSGWGVATGTATRTTFDTTLVTLPQLAQRMKALIDDFLTKGQLSS